MRLLSRVRPEENEGIRGTTTNAEIRITDGEIIIGGMSIGNRSTREVQTQIRQHQIAE